ncbi:MAG: LPS assembly lipoprotein LptE [Elusimicrobiota bacterium]
MLKINMPSFPNVVIGNLMSFRLDPRRASQLSCRLKILGMIAFVFAFLLVGCGDLRNNVDYQAPNIIIPGNVKTLSVRPFENQTSQSVIGNKLWLATTEEFIRDGRIRYVDDESKADAVIVGVITQYRESELSHDVNLVPLEYQLWVVMDLKFLDIKNNQYIWEEPLIEQKLRYFAETAPGGKTVEEAREDLWERFSRDIVRRTIEGFGSVTGVSPRSIPKEPLPDVPPPDYKKPAPY